MIMSQLKTVIIKKKRTVWSSVLFDLEMPAGKHMLMHSSLRPEVGNSLASETEVPLGLADNSQHSLAAALEGASRS